MSKILITLLITLGAFYQNTGVSEPAVKDMVTVFGSANFKKISHKTKTSIDSVVLAALSTEYKTIITLSDDYLKNVNRLERKNIATLLTVDEEKIQDFNDDGVIEVKLSLVKLLELSSKQEIRSLSSVAPGKLR